MKAIDDITTVMVRELRPMLHDPFSLVFTMVQPLVFLGLFAPLLGGIPTFAEDSPWQWFVPGTLIMMGLFGTSMTGANLLFEMQTGSHERMLVTPLNRSALLVGRALKEFAPLVVQAALIIVAVVPFGFRLYPVGALIGLVLLGLMGVGIGALSYSLALAVRNKDWVFWSVQQTLIFPLLITSGMLLPLELGPGWLQAVSRANPLTYIVDAERALFSGELVGPTVFGGLAAALLIAAVGLTVGIRSIRRAAA